VTAHHIGQQRYACTVAYDGSAYYGFQTQPQGQTIQDQIERVLKRMHRRDVRITASGRTDAGVHALGQVFHFDSELNVEEQNWTRALNAQLPPDIRITATQAVAPTFHARYQVQRKEYRYLITCAPTENPFTRHYRCQLTRPLDLSIMREACAYLIGEHDFSAFSSAKTEVEDKRRTLYHVDVTEQDATGSWPAEQTYVLRCVGNGFLYNMVRIIAGTLIDVGAGRMPPEQVKRALATKERNLAGKTAPPQGLYLWKVTYDTRFSLD
jgi:tRNA pseudouridine38-40 synthase